MVDTILTPFDDLYTVPVDGVADRVDGIGGSDTISGRSADDTLIGNEGNDSLLGGSDDDSLVGGAGADTLVGGTDENVLDGGEDGDLLLGGSVADTIMGGAGNDTISAGSGDNLMSGGAGNDIFLDIPNNGRQYFDGTGGGVDSIFVDGNYETYYSTVEGANTVNIGGQNLPYNFRISGAGFDMYFNNVNGNAYFEDGDIIPIVCFGEGTMIMTPDGERAVETLRAGDLVVTAGGQGAPVKPVRWVGHRSVDLDSHPRPLEVSPILVLPGALGAGVPHRPLRVSPEHGLLVDGVLVAAGLLVDGTHVIRLPARGRVTWFHVELDAHDLLVSEGAASESYLDMGNRHAFANAGAVAMLHADFGAAPGASPEACRPRVTGGAALDAARAALARLRMDPPARDCAVVQSPRSRGP
ncbi:Hint domain-containing protein [Roseomonas sp. CECT 9278]|uniref:Hint domain-containing protein n=1 Tax=Roseomonas sp. CECT 9278 TaxID=2845823 RepID=UPI001E611133|nr:Hint domain-containing protein [Roseomonas sp. CECT 9278]CAH0250496.1 hypothetical protein ROS9278_03132 [Roseomonas sp. CECT 9278]